MANLKIANKMDLLELQALAETVVLVQRLPPMQRIAVQQYIKGMLDNTLIHENTTS